MGEAEMPMQGQFDTDTKALQRRVEAHQKYGLKDLNEWIFERVELREGLSALDLGCGTGSQALLVARAVGDSGRVVAVDISEQALQILSQRALDLGLEGRVRRVRCSLDDLEGHIRGEAFDMVMSNYSIYYAQHPPTVFEVIHRALKPEGVFFFCGPAKGNNLGLKQFHWSLLGQEIPPESGPAVFMEESGQRLARELFRTVDVFGFQNPLRFESADALYRYWSSYNLYDPKLERLFRAAASEHFRTHSIFETVKCAVGIKAVK